jgi:murein L,D-transpeptidase YafK
MMLTLFLAGWMSLIPGAKDKETPDPAPRTGVLSGPVDQIVIEKKARRMTAYREGAALKTYGIALGFAPEGSKEKEGDGKTPEGVFVIDLLKINSIYHRALRIDYPQPQHRLDAATRGINPGGDIYIHGQPNKLPDDKMLPGDWTAGCIAVSDADISELFAAAQLGTQVEIKP